MLLCSSLVYQVSFLFLNFSRTVSKSSCKMWPRGYNLEPRCRTLLLVLLHRFTSPSNTCHSPWQWRHDRKKERRDQLSGHCVLWCSSPLSGSQRWVLQKFTASHCCSVVALCTKDPAGRDGGHFDNMRLNLSTDDLSHQLWGGSPESITDKITSFVFAVWLIVF